MNDEVHGRPDAAAPLAPHWAVASVAVLKSDQREKGRYDNSAGGYCIATSVGGTITGEGGSLIVVDDPLNASKAASEATLEACKDWWEGTMSTAPMTREEAIGDKSPLVRAAYSARLAMWLWPAGGAGEQRLNRWASSAGP